jgi:diguanylate cyclase (GGDEF)-like protein
MADMFHSPCRSIDTVARYAGDEFAIVLPENGGKEADAVWRRICERLSNDPDEPRHSMSVGVGVYPEDGTTNETLFQAVDRARYMMKLLKNTL